MECICLQEEGPYYLTMTQSIINAHSTSIIYVVILAMCKKRDGKIKKGKDMIASIYRQNPSRYCDGHNFPCTVKKVNSEMITKKRGLCLSLQSTLLLVETLTAILTSRERAADALTISLQKVHLKDKLIEKESISMPPEDADAMTRTVCNVSPLVEERYAENSGQCVFWELYNKRQMRWHTLVLRFALNLTLSDYTLSDYTHQFTNLQPQYVEELHSQQQLSESLPTKNQVALSNDDMKVRAVLYSASTLVDLWCQSRY